MDILLIDDEPDVRELLRDVLADAGHVVVEASDGTKASALLREAVFDVVVSDVRLPGVDGLTLLRTVRRDTPPADFILMTAFADVGQAVAALKEGASDYLIKPFDVDELLHHVGRIDSTRSMRRELIDARRALLLRSPSNRLVGHSAQSGEVIALDHLPAVIAEAALARSPVPSLRASRNSATPVAVGPLVAAAREFEKVHLRRAVAATGGKRVKAAEMLGISRKSLWQKLRRYDLEEGVPKPAP